MQIVTKLIHTKTKIIVVLAGVGLPFAIGFAWVFEVTPEGIRRESPVAQSDSMHAQTGRKLNLLTIGMLAEPPQGQ